MLKKQKQSKTADSIISSFNFIKVVTSIVISLALITIIVALISDEPMLALSKFLVGPIDSKRHIANVLENSIPFLFTGVAVSLMFSAGDVTLSAEGAVYFGGFIASIVVLNLNVPPVLAIIIAFIASAFAGALIAMLPIYLNKKFKVDSFVFSLLFNFVLLYVGNYVLNYHLKDVSFVGIASKLFPVGTNLPILVNNTKFNIGFFIGLFVVVLSWLFLYRSKQGYNARLVGNNAHFAKNIGLNSIKISLLVAAIGGAVSALGGAVEMLGKYPRFMWTNLPGYGWDGFMVATLALYNPKFIPLAAIFLGYIRTGAQIMNLYTDVPLELISVIQSVVILLISSRAMFRKLQQRKITENAQLKDQEKLQNREKLEVNK